MSLILGLRIFPSNHWVWCKFLTIFLSEHVIWGTSLYFRKPIYKYLHGWLFHFFGRLPIVYVKTLIYGYGFVFTQQPRIS